MNAYLARLQQELEDAIAGATAADLSRAPEGKWSAGQILEHLYQTYRGTNYGIGKSLENGKPLVSRATLKHRVGTFLVCNLGYIPTGRKAPERTLPKGLPVAEVLQNIFPEMQLMDSGLEKMESKFGAGNKVLDHLLLGPLTAEQWRKFHLAHGRHHARQIRERLVRAEAHTVSE